MSSSIEIGAINHSINFANGVDLTVQYYNASGKEIKYLEFTFVPYNAVNDAVYCTISNECEKIGKITGPIKVGSIDMPNESYLYSYRPIESIFSASWDAMWYNNTVSRIEISEVHITYMDNSEEIIDGSDLVSIDDENSVWAKDEKAALEVCEKMKEEKDKEAAIRKAEREKKEAAEKVIDDRRKELMQAYQFHKVFNCIKKKDDDEMKFHANQGLWLFIFEILGIISLIVHPVIGPALFIVFGGGAIYLALKCCQGIREDKRFEIPVISKIRLIK